MSRSPRKGRCGRDCGVCGDEGEIRRAREEEAYRVDMREVPDAAFYARLDKAMNDYDDWYEQMMVEGRCGISGQFPADASGTVTTPSGGVYFCGCGSCKAWREAWELAHSHDDCGCNEPG
jgi:hypothetical protein